MDIIQDWAAHLLGSSPNAYATYKTYSPYAATFLRYTTLAKSYFLTLLDQVTRKPDLATIALLLVILFVSLKILDMLYQTLLFWLRLAKRMLFWGGLGALGLWVYTRGPDGVVEDVGYWVEVWSGEKEYWVERERAARGARLQGRGRGARGVGTGGGGWF